MQVHTHMPPAFTPWGLALTKHMNCEEQHRVLDMVVLSAVYYRYSEKHKTMVCYGKCVSSFSFARKQDWQSSIWASLNIRKSRWQNTGGGYTWPCSDFKAIRSSPCSCMKVLGEWCFLRQFWNNEYNSKDTKSKRPERIACSPNPPPCPMEIPDTRASWAS